MMTTTLGVDLASRSWHDVGFGLVSFEAGEPGVWTAAVPDCVPRPEDALTAASLARVIDAFAVSNGLAAVALDGPQGWRQPEAPQRKGVGRWCEYQTRTQGKTGEFGRTYPQTQHRWITFCIEVFDRLLSNPRAILVNDPNVRVLPPIGHGQYYVLEVFPTSAWRSFGLVPLPGHAKAPPPVVKRHAAALQTLLGLPATAITDHHDNLQGLMAAVVGAALLGGPCRPMARGVPAFIVPPGSDRPGHRAEGLIWDARQHEGQAAVAERPDGVTDGAAEDDAHDQENPLLPDDRDETTDQVLARGVALFQALVDRANGGEAVGVSYSAFIERVYAVDRFADVAGRNYRPSDSGFVIRLATAITEAAGGRKTITSPGVSLAAGMDTFIWSTKDVDRSPKAWSSKWSVPPYSREDWLRVFPNEGRRLLKDGSTST